MTEKRHTSARSSRPDRLTAILIVGLALLMLLPPEALQAAVAASRSLPERSATPMSAPMQMPQEPAAEMPLSPDSTADADAELLVREEAPVDTTKTIVADPNSPYGLDGKIKFNPSPERAVWMSALFPGLGQIYNRRYWKLPIIVGGFMGLGYATSWNNSQLQDYVQGYRDLLDNDPSTRSYMNFFPPNTDESSLDKSWLQSTLRSRRNFYRRNRDLCIICIVALYLLCMVDAYVDASMAHFDISPDLSMDVAPAMIVSPSSRRPALGLNWAFTF